MCIFYFIELMINREITPLLTSLFEQYPFVTVTGPRQSGKTTLCRQVFPQLNYVNLELPDVREFARSDPRGLLSNIENGAIIDEIQHVPEFLSYLQVFADETRRNSLFVITGSENFKLSESVSQSLAGRTGLLYLLPFSLAESRLFRASETVDELIFRGFYPRVLDQNLNPHQAYSAYVATYVERDLRRISQLRDLPSFENFLRICAGRIGQLINLVSMGSDVGISHTTARHWLNLMEASFITFRLKPFHASLRKRLVKMPKLYFYDVGLAAYLLGIEHPQQIATHPLRGALFENLVVVEALKYRFNRGLDSNLSFFRDSRGLEVDLLYQTANEKIAMEIKSSATPSNHFFDALKTIGNLNIGVTKKFVVYSGATGHMQSTGEFVPFGDLVDALNKFETERQSASVADNMQQ